MSAKHSPGPWFARLEANGHAIYASGGDVFVAEVMIERGASAGETVANARLIAAAPDLLDALKAAEAHFKGTWSEGGTDHKAMLAAIAKAEGRP